MDKSQTVFVAPREVRDLVYRASRIAGCDPGTAEQIAQSVEFGEIHHGGAIGAFCGSLASGELPVSPWVTAPDALLAAETAVRAAGSASVTFEPAVPLATIAATLWQGRMRGVANTGPDHRTRGDRAVSSVGLHRVDGEVSPPGRARIAEADEAAHRLGIEVDRDVFSRLEADAAGFLVAESVLDQIE
ncbi:MAG: hypothetical protein F4011_05875 [Acidimicrobiaceae bacterium]|nr:hypothetical protein [Acidimicrobiaceae bacterium]MYH00875.1 hypothetical protein [Acidimicrobiaceae bacterium]MYL03697.1 hypothetical protein [Acidimicrobiaceae bacterium]